MTMTDKEKQLDHINDMLIEDVLETSDEEIRQEVQEETGDVDVEAARLRSLVGDTVHIHKKAKFEAAKKARLQKTEIESSSKLNVLSLDKKRAILKAISSNDNPNRQITLAARLENDASEDDLDKDLQCLLELGVIDEEGNLCEDD